MKKNLLFYLILAVTLQACTTNDELQGYSPIPVNAEIPSNFPNPTYDLQNNPLTEEGIALGKKLFYEGRLSSNNAISCAFCHQQEFAFTHHGHNLSHGVEGRVGIRNAPAIQNMFFKKDFMWDGAASHLDLLSIIPITNPLEMDESLSSVIGKLENDPTYKIMFAEAFEDGQVNSENLLKGLSQFMITMVSANSKYDRVTRDQEATFTPLEQQGQLVFNNKCSSCHATALFTDQSFKNNGLPINSRLNDQGRFDIVEREEDRFKFKVPSLRNVSVTAPYMHDGRFTTLQAVLDFYSDGMVDTGTIDPLLIKPDGSYGIELSPDDKEALIAFLNTLTDNTFLNDPRFAEF